MPALCPEFFPSLSLDPVSAHMPHFLCFTDLSLTTPGNPIKSSVATDADATPPSAPASAVVGEGRHRPTTFFVRDEDKKSSFALEQPVALVYDS